MWQRLCHYTRLRRNQRNSHEPERTSLTPETPQRSLLPRLSYKPGFAKAAGSTRHRLEPPEWPTSIPWRLGHTRFYKKNPWPVRPRTPRSRSIHYLRRNNSGSEKIHKSIVRIATAGLGKPELLARTNGPHRPDSTN